MWHALQTHSKGKNWRKPENLKLPWGPKLSCYTVLLMDCGQVFVKMPGVLLVAGYWPDPNGKPCNSILKKKQVDQDKLPNRTNSKESIIYFKETIIKFQNKQKPHQKESIYHIKQKVLLIWKK